jgi:two-component system cell cycle response regulator
VCSSDLKKAMGVLLIDIDHFKKVNDTYGHNIGDEVLKIFAERLKNSLRSFDLVARLGGEEFVAILPEVSTERAYIIAERLRRAIAEEPFPCSIPEGQIVVTSSLGGTIIGPGEHTALEILERADKCLYQAKESGRNCSVFEDVGKLDPEQYLGAARQPVEE